MLLRRAALLLLCACGPAPPPPPQRCVPPRPVGDLSQPLQLLPISLDAQGALHALHDGDTVLLQKPPQGGYVIYAGAAARNLESCGARVTAYLIDQATGAPLTNLDQRNADLTVQTAGYFWPAPANGYTQAANIPSCPDALHVGVVGRSARLHVEVQDANRRAGTVEVSVTAVCPPGDSACACVCGPNPNGC